MKKSDYAVTAVFVSTLIFMSINVIWVWTGWIYINAIISAGILIWSILKWDSPRHLRTAGIVGLGSAIIYSSVDSLFVRSVLILNYLRSDIKLFSTPMSIVITWMIMITIAGYLYLRTQEFISASYQSSFIVGVMVFATTLAINELGNAGRLWSWNMLRVPRPLIGSTPLYTALANSLVPFVAPYVLRSNPIIGLFRCAIAISGIQLLCFMLFRTIFLPVL